ncbi:glycyl-radical enzyme activating protein [Scatolibacter rhodanostii]|uniref:glycyl-radical enzyme activating protein n=1 Tax=Scatolibacter rhodanostii TaxID=2014781 RepID=UPI00190EC69A|nr:glycyl-radical enzyme activating protein [Scatolibacter rhodanostii]
MMLTATIFDIQPFSVYDGPGIRTTVFLKGCNLRCKWCHNPESWKKDRQLLFYQEKCINCMKCFEVCPQNAHVVTTDGHEIDRKLCNLCGACTDVCYAGALKISGIKMTVDEVFKRIKAEEKYYQNSGGGVTFSGGEPLLQKDFLKEILIRCKNENIHTAVDTAGCVPYSYFEEITSYTDLFLYDLKAASTQLHKELTGLGNEPVFENLKKLSDLKKEIIVRVPCIGGANLHEIEKIAKLLENISVKKVELLAYHRMGEAKSAALSQEKVTFSTPTKEEMIALKQKFLYLGIPIEYQE